MALVICPRHGRQGAAAVCAHVAIAVAAQAPVDGPLYPVSASYAGLDIGSTWLCAACAREHRVPGTGLHLTGEAGLERYFSEIGFTPVCHFCFVSARQATA
jgi:hypothetical protein